MLLISEMSVMSLGVQQKVVTGRHEKNALLMWGGDQEKVYIIILQHNSRNYFNRRSLIYCRH
jgi:hypothetical protein